MGFRGHLPCKDIAGFAHRRFDLAVVPRLPNVVRQPALENRFVQDGKMLIASVIVIPRLP